MAVFQKTQPEDILGMSQDDFKKKLESSATKEDVDAIKSTVEGSLSEIRQALSNLTTPKPEPVVESTPDDDVTGIITDPKGFIQKETAGLKASNLQTQADLQEMRARQNPMFANVFAQYGGELTQLAAKMPLESRAGQGFWEWHIRTFLGDKFVRGELKSQSYPSLIGSSSVLPNPDGGLPDDPNKGFTSEQAAFFKEHNVPLDSAAKIDRIMRRDGNPLTLEAYKAAGNA